MRTKLALLPYTHTDTKHYISENQAGLVTNPTHTDNKAIHKLEPSRPRCHTHTDNKAINKLEPSSACYHQYTRTIRHYIGKNQAGPVTIPTHLTTRHYISENQTGLVVIHTH